MNSMTTANDQHLGRCLGERACPVRYTDGQSRCCAMHGSDDGGLADRAREYGDIMAAPATGPVTGRVVRGTGRV